MRHTFDSVCANATIATTVSDMVSAPARSTSLLVLALLVTWLVWGSSFLAVQVALVDLPPLLLMGTRFAVAGAVATAIGLLLARRTGGTMPSALAWRDAAIVGAGWIGIGMGTTGWAGTRLPTGICALLVATAPLWMTAIQVALLRAGAPDRMTLAGLGVGIAGVALLLLPAGGSTPEAIDVPAAVALSLSTAAWAGASVFATRAVKPTGLVLSVGMQMLTGGIVLLGAAVVAGEVQRVSIADIGLGAGSAWTYLVLAASLGGFVAYGWLLEHVGTTIAATHAFVNPVVAMALGVALLGEQVQLRTLESAAAVVVAVVLLLVGERRAATPAAAPTPVRAAGRPPRAVRRHVPAFEPRLAMAARRSGRPWHATDGMDALAIDAALDRHVWDDLT